MQNETYEVLFPYCDHRKAHKQVHRVVIHSTEFWKKVVLRICL